MIARSIDGLPESLTRDDVLDNCTLYWLTNTGVSASRLYRENTFNYFAPKGVNIPVAVSVFPDEIYLAPRSWAEKAYPKLVHFNKVAKGGHLRPGNSRRTSRKNYARDSDHCADSGAEAPVSASSRMADHVVNGVIGSAARRSSMESDPPRECF